MNNTPLLSAPYEERFESSDLQNVVTVEGGSLNIEIQNPNGAWRLFEVLPAPQAPLTATSRLVTTKGCTLRFTPIGGASFWIER